MSYSASVTPLFALVLPPKPTGVLLLLAWACSLGHPLALTGVVLYLAWVTCFQIRPEERVLARRFPDAYRDYRRRVRRWL